MSDDEKGPSGPDEHFATNLRELRNATGLSQEDLAERMTGKGFPFHQTTIYKIENGSRRVQLSEALALADALGVPLDMLATRSFDNAQELAALAEAKAFLVAADRLRERIEPSGYDFHALVDAFKEQLNDRERTKLRLVLDRLPARDKERLEQHLVTRFGRLDVRTGSIDYNLPPF